MATPEQERNSELVRRSFELWDSGDVEGSLALLTDDVEVVAPPELGNPGTFRGRKGFLKWTRQWFDVWEEFEQDVREVTPVGERHVVATIHQSARGRGSGVSVDREIGWVVGFRGELFEFITLRETPELGIQLARSRDAA